MLIEDYDNLSESDWADKQRRRAEIQACRHVVSHGAYIEERRIKCRLCDAYYHTDSREWKHEAMGDRAQEVGGGEEVEQPTQEENRKDPSPSFGYLKTTGAPEGEFPELL